MNQNIIFEMTDSRGKVEEITRWWMERWLSKRIESDDVLTKVAQHTLIQPIRHGARVTLPRVDDKQYLFDDIYH